MTGESDYMADGLGKRTCLFRSMQTIIFQYFLSILFQLASATFDEKVRLKVSVPECHFSAFLKHIKCPLYTHCHRYARVRTLGLLIREAKVYFYFHVLHIINVGTSV